MITAEKQHQLAQMTTMEQTEWISVFCGKHKLKYGEFVGRYGHMIPPPMSYSEREEAIGRGAYVRKERDMICETCGETFIGKTSRARFCPECLRKRKAEQVKRCKNKDREPSPLFPEHDVVCQRCGITFATRGRSTKRCPECAKKQAQENSIRWHKKQYSRKRLTR